MYMKKYERGKEKVVALCDKELIGKVLREGGLVLDLERYSAFYVGEITSEKAAAEALETATSVNLVGKKAVGLAIKRKLAEKGSERIIEGVPHLQIYRMKL
jgi:hypothetical protein